MNKKLLVVIIGGLCIMWSSMVQAYTFLNSSASHSPNSNSVLIWLHDGGWSTIHSAQREFNQLNELKSLGDEPWLDIVSLRYPLAEEGGTQMVPISYIYDKITELKTLYNYTNIYIGGYSAGAHLATLYSAFFPSHVSKVIAIAPPTDLADNSLTTVMNGLIEQYVSSPDSAIKEDYSPVHQIEQNDIDYLIIYNTEDNTIPYINQVENFIDVLNALEIDNQPVKITSSSGHLFFQLPEPPIYARTVLVNSIVDKIKSFLLTTPLYRYLYWNPNIDSNHFYTKTKGDYSGYTLEKVEGRVFCDSQSNTVPLHRYFSSSRSDHLYTIQRNDSYYSQENYSYEGIECYVFASQVSGSVPLYRYDTPQYTDHFYTTTRNDTSYAQFGYVYEGIACYVYPNN